ncbi:protein FAM200C-like [Oratosquilla oratoria]|uniref:protein FAM200C-like n=1 Tax=Oratosquilla oratoria TaxID=337810 RepID=UPI003F774778
MLGQNSGFGALVKADAPHISVLHRDAFATKTLPSKLGEILNIVMECINYVRNSVVKHRIFKELCNEKGSEFEVLLYHPNVRWLFQGKVQNRVFALRVELARILREHQHRPTDFGVHGRCLRCSQSSQSTATVMKTTNRY